MADVDDNIQFLKQEVGECRCVSRIGSSDRDCDFPCIPGVHGVDESDLSVVQYQVRGVDLEMCAHVREAFRLHVIVQREHFGVLDGESHLERVVALIKAPRDHVGVAAI